MKAIAAVLIVLGIFAFAVGSFSYTKKEKVLDAGPVEVTTERTKRVPIPPVLGGLAIVAGVGMLLIDRKH